jgi:SAM-dependent methyltransferase
MNPVNVDIDDVLRDVASVLAERETGRSQEYRSEVREVDDVVYLLPGAWQNIVNSLLSLDQSLTPLDGMFPVEAPEPAGGVARAFKRLVKRVIQKSVYWYVNPVVAQLHSMHAATSRAMREVVDQLRSVNDRLEIMEKDNLEGRVKSLEGEQLDERVGRLERTWRQAAAPQAQAPAGAAPAGAPGGEALAARGVGKDRARAGGPRFPAFNFDYYWFESIHRGDRGLIKRRLQPYLEHFEGCGNVLDLGCGKGEFLELLSEKGIGGYGIDLDGDAVQYCTDLGLAVERAEALSHLETLADDSLDGVFISQVVEHMTPGELIELVGLTHGKLKPGGRVVVETPNPQCLLIFASFFYADLSHVQPIHPETMRFLLLSAGFREVDIQLTNPVPRNQRLARIVMPEGEADDAWVDELNANLEKLNSVLFGYMDYAAVARK